MGGISLTSRTWAHETFANDLCRGIWKAPPQWSQFPLLSTQEAQIEALILSKVQEILGLGTHSIWLVLSNH
jgi:hypothetical protein